MDKKYQLLETTEAFSGFFKLNRYRLQHSSFEGGDCPPIVRERLEGLAAVSVLLYDPKTDEVVLIEQFRVGLMGQEEEPWAVETVSGFCDKEHEQPEDVARREVQEETGCELLALTPIGEFYVSPGMSVEKISLYCGCVDARCAGGVHGLPEEGEEIRVLVMPRRKAMDALFDSLNTTSVIMTLQWLAMNYHRLQEEWR